MIRGVSLVCTLPPQFGAIDVKIRAVLIGLVISVIMSILLLLVAEAVVPPLERVAPDASPAMRVVVAVLSSLFPLVVGGYVAGRRAGRSGALNGALVGALSWGIPALLALAFSPGEAVSRVSGALVSALTQVGAGALGGHFGAAARRKSEAARLREAHLPSE
jgi:putative membrane protein (TIGR04086 family)